MARVKGSYRSLSRGVSEQVPHDRLEGQHFEQVNLVSDPIRGLIRRRGSVFKSKLRLPDADAGQESALTSYREYSFIAGGVKYAAFFSRSPTTSGTRPLVLFNKDQQALFPVEMTGLARSRAAAGITSAASVGQYLLLSTPRVPTISVTDMVEATAGNAAVWIRGGAYSRTYQLTYGDTTVSYTTPKSYYDGALDTSDIPSDAEDYQKRVNDRVNAYNTAVNQYIASAQAAIQPESIAAQLTSRLQDAGFNCGYSGAHIHIYDLVTPNARLTGTDGGDGSFMRVTHRAVSSLDDLTKMHHAGAVVAVEVSADDTYYVKAERKRDTGSNFQEVSWIEATKDQLDIEFPFLIATVSNGTMYVATSPSELKTLLPSNHPEVPDIVPRKSGDDESNPRPDFFKRPISHMTVFQDRLLVCSGANVFMSVPGDYFNWFRKSALRVDPDDPIEVYALGAEDDIIRGSGLIDRNLILIGESRHYALSGREALSPTVARVSVQASHEGTTDAAPQSLGNLMFYSQFQGGLTKLHQVQVGAFGDSLDSFSVSQQITKYLRGRPRQLVTSSQPNMVLMTTEGLSNGVYVFTFLDSPGQTERLFDSWSRWEWDKSLGQVLGVTNSDVGFVVITCRSVGGELYLVADEFSRDSSVDPMPYLDSKVPLDHLDTWAQPSAETWAVLPGTHPRRYLGRSLATVDSMLQLSDVSSSDVLVGVQFDSFYDPTPPYLRDENDTALLSGRFVLSSLGLTLAESAGITITLRMREEVEFKQTLVDESGFRIADPLSPLGAVPLTDRRVSCFVGREVREHRLRVSSKGWTPLNIATVEWSMQTFDRR